MASGSWPYRAFAARMRTLPALMLVSNNRKAMGTRTNGRLLNIMGWITAAVMSIAAIALIARPSSAKATPLRFQPPGLPVP
jgi:hypothetical protein